MHCFSYTAGGKEAFINRAVEEATLLRREHLKARAAPAPPAIDGGNDPCVCIHCFAIVRLVC